MERIHTDNAPAAIGPYSQGYISNGFFFASGQSPLDPKTGAIVSSEFGAQTEQVMQNLSAVLSAAKLDFTHVVKTTCFLADMGDFAAFNAIYEKYFTGRPARTCVAVKTLPMNILVEVELIAEVNAD